MINGGNATVFVADVDRSIEFYTKTLGLKLRMRAGERWAEVVAGNELVIGLHKAEDMDDVPLPSPRAIKIGLHLEGALDEAMTRLSASGVEFTGTVEDDGPVRLAYFNDPDANPLYLCEYVEAASAV